MILNFMGMSKMILSAISSIPHIITMIETGTIKEISFWFSFLSISITVVFLIYEFTENVWHRRILNILVVVLITILLLFYFKYGFKGF